MEASVVEVVGEHELHDEHIENADDKAKESDDRVHDTSVHVCRIA